MSQNWTRLLSQLLRMTRENKLLWKETSDDSVFITSLESGVIELEYDEVKNDFEIRIIDKKGQGVDAFGDGDLLALSGASWLEEVRSLFVMIKRSISGADIVLGKILKELDDKEEEIPF